MHASVLRLHFGGGGVMFLLQVELCSVSESPQKSSLPGFRVGRKKRDVVWIFQDAESAV